MHTDRSPSPSTLNHLLKELRRKKYELNAQQRNLFTQLYTSTPDVDVGQKKYYSLIVNGIPSGYRVKVWPQLLDNLHGITPTWYKTLSDRAQMLKASLQKEKVFQKQKSQQYQVNQLSLTKRSSMQQPQHASKQFQSSKPINQNYSRWLSTIFQDIPRTFPELKQFTLQSQQSRSLVSILSSFFLYRQDIGYIQGMSQIAALLFLQLNQQLLAFTLFCSVVTCDTLYSFYTFSEGQIARFCKQVENRVRLADEDYYFLLRNNEIGFDSFLMTWIMTLFTRCLSLDCIVRLWDVLFANNLDQFFIEEVCLRVALGFKEQVSHQINKEGSSRRVLKILNSGKLGQIWEQSMLSQVKLIPATHK